ncbi:MAG TPA: hypothetical protein VF329_04255 [Gammaproteobacteria bacterium]
MRTSSAIRTVRSALRRAGVSVELVDGRIRARPAAALTDELRALIREHRDALADVLRYRPALEPPLRLKRRGFRYVCHGCERGCWWCGAWG